MATLNVQNLLVEINKKIVQTSDNEELLMLSKAVSVLKTGAIFTVGTFANLPDASENVGKLYFVENDGILYFSVVTSYESVETWIPITQINLNTLWNWGYVQSTTIRTSPVSIPGFGTNWCDFSINSSTKGAIKTDGTLWTWSVGGGGNVYGTLGTGSTSDRTSPGTVAGGGTNWCQISNLSSTNAVVAVKTDGTLWTWGRNCSGLLGDGTTVCKSSPGTVAGGGTTWCQVNSSNTHTQAIKCDGTLWTWGCNNVGALGDGTTIDRCSPGTIAGGGAWCSVSGLNSIAAIKTDGTLWTWGFNKCGIFGDGTSGTIRSSPGTVAGGGTNWCQVFSQGYHTAAIKTDGTLWTWGCNACGMLGDGTTLNRCSPGTIAGGGTTWCQVGTSRCRTVAVKTDGTVWTWGRNYCAGLGDGTLTDRSSPGTIFKGGTNWFKVLTEDRATMAIQRETL